MNLDAPNKYLQTLDPGKVGESISCLPDQIEQILAEAEKISFPKSYNNIRQIVLNGMGGSNLGGRIIQSVFEAKLKVPLIIAPGYNVPGFVDDKTLFILSSYSGNTEETLSVYQEVKKRKAKIVAVTGSHKNNKLEKLMKEDNLAGLAFTLKNNPSDQPRLGLGQSIFSLLIILDKLNIIQLEKNKIKTVIKDLRQQNQVWHYDSQTSKNQAKRIAKELQGKIPVLIGAEFLEGNLHAFRNQVCENSKNFADYLTLPDLNHFLLEGLAYPKSNHNNLIFLFLDSNQYSPRVQTRNKLTKQVIEKNGLKTLTYQVKSKSLIGQSFEVLQLGSWITFYLAILNQVNPSLIPWVNWFKEKLD